MKDLIEKVLAYLPQYLSDFGSLFSGPKRFMAQKNAKPEDTLAQSLVFLGVSLVLLVVMTASLLPPGRDLWSYVGAKAVTSLLAISLTAIALRLSWRLVGGKATVRSYFVTYAYFIGVVIVIFALFLLLAEGVFKVLAPDLYAHVIEAKLKKQPIPDLSGSSVPFVSFLILAAGYFFISVWVFVGWGAYRELNGLSKWRSFMALMLFGVFAWAISAIVVFVASVA